MTEAALTRKTRWLSESREWLKTIAWTFVVYAAFTTVAFAQFKIPSESMVPHLEVGDRVTVSKFAYGYSRHSLPFDVGRLLPASDHRLFETMPRRGDVIVFIHPLNGQTMIKRLIGLPGDVIELRGGMLYINGEAVETTAPQLLVRRAHDSTREWAKRMDERLPDGVTHAAHDLTPNGPFDNFGPYTVPERHLFFMGDNRDNSLDSRWDGMGPVPIENLIGRAEIVYATGIDACARDATVSCSLPRWMRRLSL